MVWNAIPSESPLYWWLQRTLPSNTGDVMSLTFGYGGRNSSLRTLPSATLATLPNDRATSFFPPMVNTFGDDAML